MLTGRQSGIATTRHTHRSMYGPACSVKVPRVPAETQRPRRHARKLAFSEIPHQRCLARALPAKHKEGFAFGHRIYGLGLHKVTKDRVLLAATDPIDLIPRIVVRLVPADRRTRHRRRGFDVNSSGRARENKYFVRQKQDRGRRGR